MVANGDNVFFFFFFQMQNTEGQELAYLVVWPELTLEQYVSSMLQSGNSDLETMAIFKEKSRADTLAKRINGTVIQINRNLPQ